AAHIAMMEDEVVNKREWITKEKFIDMIGFTNLIPGPNSTEMAILLGHARGGKKGLFIAGISFILPAMLIVLGFAVLYKNYGDITYVASIFDAIKPVILAIVLQALFRLSKTALTRIESFVLFGIVLTLSLIGITEIPLLLGAALLMFIFRKLKEEKKTMVIEPISLFTLFLIFVKIGAVLYGSGYVLLAFLRTEFVDNLGLITSAQLIDAVAVGQFTPGPVFTTATFIGYLILDIPGALVATVGIFLPSFLIIWLLHPLIDKMRNSNNIKHVLDGVNAAAIALMAGVTIELGIASINSILYGFIFLVSAFLLIRYKVNATLLILGGALIGFIMFLI
ncbi:MAG: chromate transporter, partial [Acholeplasmataceae bacterium]|nr:chromate transporter [Acholeplasmataceae bacterium]